MHTALASFDTATLLREVMDRLRRAPPAPAHRRGRAPLGQLQFPQVVAWFRVPLGRRPTRADLERLGWRKVDEHHWVDPVSGLTRVTEFALIEERDREGIEPELFRSAFASGNSLCVQNPRQTMEKGRAGRPSLPEWERVKRPRKIVADANQPGQGDEPNSSKMNRAENSPKSERPGAGVRKLFEPGSVRGSSKAAERVREPNL